MDNFQIPKSFWHSVSLCIVGLTSTFIWISIIEGRLHVKLDKLEISAGQVREDTRDLQEKINSMVKEKVAMNDAYTLLNDELTQLESSLGNCTTNQDELEMTVSNLKSSLESKKQLNIEQVADLQAKEQKLEKIQNRLDKISPEISLPKQSAEILFTNNWAKKGYFLALGADARLNVKEVSDASVIFTLSTTVAESELKDIKIGETLEVALGNYKYKVSLNSVKRSGVNIFNKAGFFKVSRIEI